MRKFLSLFAAILFAGSMMATDPAAAGTTLFSEDFSSYAKDAVPSGTVTTATGRVVYGDASVIYTAADGASITKIYNENTGGGTAPEILISKSNGSLTIAGIPSGGAKEITVSWTQNKQKLKVEASGTGYSGSKEEKPANVGTNSVDITVADEADETFTLIFTCTGSSNVRVDDILVVVKTAGEASQGGDDPQPTTQDLYLKLSSDWAGWPAKYAVYYFNDTENGWSEFMTAVTGEENTYTATIPVGYSKVIFVRFNSEKTATGNWDDKWSQTVNLTIPEGKNHFTVTSGGTGDQCDGVWAVYPVVPTFYVKGTFDEWGDGHEMTEGSYTFENLAAGTYQIKVVDDANNWYGFEVLDQTKSSVNIYEGSDGNIKFTLAEAGNVTVAYANSKITVTGTFVAPSTKFTVTVPEGTEKTYIAGNFNNWTPAEMTLKAGEEDVFELTVEGVESDTVAYKYLAGADWKFEEVIENNRSYNAADEVSAWKAVPTIYKYAKVKEAPVNWTGHYIIAWADHKPHSAIKVGSSSKDDFVAADDALVFTDGDTISIMEGMDFAVNIRFGASEGAYTLQLPDGKYIYLPNANGVCSKDEATDMYLAVSPSTTQTGIQIGDKADMSNRVIYNNSTNYRSYTNKYETTGYILPTLYRLVDEAFDCQDGPYAILVNGKDIENTVAGEEFDGYKQYVAYLSLTKGDSIQLINTSCGATWLPAIEEGGMSAHFKKGVNAATIDTTGCFDLYIKMKEGDDKLYIGAGICADDTIRYTVRGKGGILGEDFEKAIDSKEDTLELALEAGKYELKVVVGEDWKGFEQLTDTATGLKVGDQGNICFELNEAGAVSIVYNDSVFKLIGNFYVAPIKYYIAGSMTKWAEEMVELLPLEEKADSLGIAINLEADSLYAFKVVRVQGTDTAWYGMQEFAAMTYGNSEGWYIYKSEGEINQANVGLQTTEEGNYAFVVNVAEDHLAVSVAIPARYYAKYQLSEDGTDWGWKQLTKKDALYMTDTIVYRGSGMNIDNAMSEEPVLYYSHDKANTDVRHFTGDSVVALDTVVFAFNPADSTLTAQLVGRYVAPAVHYYLAGTMTNWKADSIELVALEDKADSLGVTVALKADSLYEYKVVRVQGTDTAWYGLNETAAMTYGNSEGWYIYKSEGEVNQANVGIQTTKEGEYSFALKVAEDHLEVSVAIPAPTPTAAVTGSMNNWEGRIPFELAEDEKTATLFVDNMKSGEYDFRMIIGGQERSNGWWFKRDVLGAAGITGNDENAMKLIADVDGDYTITWFFANDSIHFEFPAPAMFYVTGDSALVKDAAGLEKKDEWNAKAIKAEQDTLVLSLKADQEYKLKLIEDGNWEGGKVYGYDALTQEDKAGLSADNDNNIVFKLNEDGDVKVVYFWEEDTEIGEWKMTFKLIGDFYVEPEIPHTYTVVGPSLPNKWDQTSTASDMTLVEGVYTYVLADVELKAGAHEYKIVEDHAWDVAFPQNGNASFSVEKDGIYDVTFTLNKETKAYTAVPELKQEIIIAPTAVLMGLAEVEPWTVGESMEVAEGFKTASITKHFVPSKAEGDTLKFKVVINDAWRSNAYLYHRDFVGAAGITMNIEGEDCNMKVVVDVEGDYTFTWTFENDSIGITFPEKPEPVMNDGYYIIGLNGWDVADLTADDMFWSTGIETNEFSINLTLRLNDEFKVVRIVDDMIQEWYPAEGDNYVVDDHHYGATTVYFRPNYDGNEDWFAGCIYVLPTSTVDIDNLDVNAPAVKILRDGQILIIKGNKTFNVQGQLVK